MKTTYYVCSHTYVVLPTNTYEESKRQAVPRKLPLFIDEVSLADCS